ncbi:peptidoglycan-binding domain-containing protein [Aliiruegeria sabulilitoris]|uniref:peptidoglycan-binding domain-containing protein n=1 Tax=Aliiruegeria sabulilitoris TaxID=1510458 RepID=UPI00083089A9|nr:peptidoglycan-binding domain-containing protein [Aliiruegeria sabulilitoris]NDR57992.1 peptidoglycan-binding protein [Pseudoruegeria sp. M32A2M]
MSRLIPNLVALAAVIGVAATAGAARADRALVIGAPEAERRGLWGSGDGVDTAQALRDAGFEVITADAGSVTAMRAALSGFLAGIEGEERVVVHLSGSFLHGAERSWLVEADKAARPDLANVDDIGLSVDTVLAVAGRVPGAAVVALGAASGKVEAGDGLESGLFRGAVPQGVTIVEGGSEAVASFVAGPLLEEGRSLTEVISGTRGLRGRGFLPERVIFLPVGEERPVAPPNAAEVERAIWQATKAQDSVGGYESYLERFPEGFFVAEAREAIERIRTEPNRLARLAEEELGLSRDERRKIQRELTLLDYQPRGVDGVFGQGSRAAIMRFQTRNGFPATGYLDATQVERLSLQAERRAAELAAEQRRQELERDKLDGEAWAAVTGAEDEAGLRTYLERYPEGLYAPIARERLAAIEAAARARAEAQELADWQAASEAGTVAALNAYLAAHPEGAHAAQARERVAVLEGGDSAAMQQARAVEGALGLNAVTRTMIEQRLEQLNLAPGNVDGTFDADTRAALRRFQRERGLEETGYMSQQVVSQMLADFGNFLISPR